MKSLFDDLATRIESRWHSMNYRMHAFPPICAQTLRETSLVDRVSVSDLVDWALSCPRLPRQIDIDAEFAEPPLTLFENDRFYVSAYFWVDATTRIHEHGFWGAFQVLEGSSLHSTFDFEPRESLNEHLHFGTLTERTAERLRRGDVREIHAGAATIHSLFHLERPSVTLVVRTYGSASEAATFRPQYSYSRVGAAWNPWYEQADLSRRVQLLRLLQRTQPEHLLDHCTSWLRGADAVSAFVGLRKIARLLPPDDCDALLHCAAAQHPTIADVASRIIDDDRREAAILSQRATATDPEVRFFLALLSNVHGRHLFA